jgi:hypothetical protein
MATTEFLEILKSTGEVELTVKRSGKWTTRPVWFAVDGATVYLLPMYGKDTKWYKYATTNPEIELSVRGKKVRGEAKPVFDAQKLADVIDQFGAKYGDLKKYYKKLDTAIEVTIKT